MTEPIDDAARRARRTYDAAADTFDAAANGFWALTGRRTIERLGLAAGACAGSLVAVALLEQRARLQQRLSDAQIKLLRRWIDEGAKWPEP